MASFPILSTAFVVSSWLIPSALSSQVPLFDSTLRIESLDSLCSPSAFKNLEIDHIEVLAITATALANHTFHSDLSAGNSQETIAGIDFCNVTVTFTHPGWNDVVNVMTYLPKHENWNGRLLSNGGAGYITGGPTLEALTMAPGLSQGFASSTTDGGHSCMWDLGTINEVPWALTSTGNINWPLLVNFASVGLHDMAVVGKAITSLFYGLPPKFSYFYGASTGGRQGHMLAQRYPNDFDGILAVMPGINWNKFLLADLWPSMVMNWRKIYPRPCELRTITAAAIDACDELDGVKDMIISRQDLCHFDPTTIVGKTIDCDGHQIELSQAAAEIATAAWEGPRSSNGEFQWFGLSKDADISNGVAMTICDNESNSQCRAIEFSIGSSWARYWVLRQPELKLATLKHEDWDTLFYSATNQFGSVIDASDPNLSSFKKAGGKLISWHGTADETIPINGTIDYVTRVLQRDPEAHDYYRFFVAPGNSHRLSGNVSPSVLGVLDQLVDWVEKGIAPEILRTVGPNKQGIVLERDLCLFPKIQHYIGGDMTKPDAFKCI